MGMGVSNTQSRATKGRSTLLRRSQGRRRGKSINLGLTDFERRGTMINVMSMKFASLLMALVFLTNEDNKIKDLNQVDYIRRGCVLLELIDNGEDWCLS